MTSDQLDAYIAELIAIDPSFKEKESILRAHLQELAELKNNIVVSDDFVRTVRIKLVDTSSKPSLSRLQIIIQSLHMQTKYITLGSAGVIATLAIGIGAYTFFTKMPPSPLAMQGGNSQSLALGPNAFGTIGAQGQVAAPGAHVSEAMISSQIAIEPGFGGGGMAVSEDVAGEGKMMIMPYYQFVYEYTGDAIALPTDLPVYRRSLRGSQASTAAAAIRSIDNGMIDLPAGLMVEQVNLRSPNRNGYSYNIDFANEQVNLYEESNVYNDNWKGNNALSESELLAIANRFMSAQGISLDGYGTPEIDTQYLRYQGDTGIVPQYLSIIFPLITPSDEVVYSQNGEVPAGITVTIDQARKKVTSVNNIKRTAFESSAYELASDITRVLAVAAQGGSVYEPWYPEGAEKNIVELGTPTVVYIEYYQYNEATFTNDELYVPALRFPIVSEPKKDSYYTPSYITVPLVASLLQAPEDTDLPIPRPMPVEPMYAPAIEPAI